MNDIAISQNSLKDKRKDNLKNHSHRIDEQIRRRFIDAKYLTMQVDKQKIELQNHIKFLRNSNLDVICIIHRHSKRFAKRKRRQKKY